MNPGAEFMTPVTEDRAIAQWTLESMRQITKALDRVTDRLDVVHEKLDAIGERVTRIEANRLEHEVAEISDRQKAALERIDKLERDKDRRDGAFGLMGWVLRHWPSLIAIIAAVMLFLEIRGINR